MMQANFPSLVALLCLFLFLTCHSLIFKLHIRVTGSSLMFVPCELVARNFLSAFVYGKIAVFAPHIANEQANDLVKLAFI